MGLGTYIYLFSTFTDGTLIDEEFADEMLRVQNFMPAISIEEYFDQMTDMGAKFA